MVDGFAKSKIEVYKMHIRPRQILVWVVVIGGLAAVLYNVVLKPAVVTPHRPYLSTILEEALGTGSIESHRMVDVSFEVSGRVTQLHVDQGDHVAQGQVLAAIESSTYQAEVALTDQEVTLAQSTLRRLGADIERAQAVLDGATANLDRVRPLVESGVNPVEALDIAKEREKIASAELTRSRSAQLEGRQAVSAAQRRLDRANAQLDQTIVHSPYDGVVIRRDREVGDVAVPGAVIFKLAATDTVWASVWVDETYLESLAVGLPARITLRSEPGREMRGVVSRIGREVDRETRELLVDVSFNTVPDKIVFGQRVDLWIELDRKSDALSIPAGFLVRVNGKEGVFLGNTSRATFQSVEIGLRGRERVEVVKGVSAEDIVLEPYDAAKKPLRGGERIRLRDQTNDGERR